MTNRKTNLFIVEISKEASDKLNTLLSTQFGSDLNITSFQNGESCLQSITKDVDVVILGYYLKGKNGLEILKLIKDKSPKTEVIILSSNEDVALAIQTFRSGAKDFVERGPKQDKKISHLIYSIITAPIRILKREFGVSKFTAVFLVTFLLMAVVVLFVLYIIRSKHVIL